MNYLTLSGYRTLAGSRLPRRKPAAEFTGADRAAAEAARDAAIPNAARYDAEPGLSVLLAIDGVRDPVYQARRSSAWTDVSADDEERVEAALTSASGEVRAALTEDLLDADGDPVATVPPRLADVLPGIVFAIAEFAVTDGATGAEDAVTTRYHAARKLLRELKSEPERPAARAALIEGASQWIRGAEPPAGSAE